MPTTKDSRISPPRQSSPRTTYVTREEFVALKRKVEELRNEVNVLKQRLEQRLASA